MYRLTRDDGAEFRVRGGIWESALELAYLYGWRPAGTAIPQTEAWRNRQARPGTPIWDSQDYFSHESQYVGREDARALSRAVLRALGQIPAWETDDGIRPEAPGADPTQPVPSRASAVADGLSGSRRVLMRRLAAFADRAGFTIGSVP